MADFRKYDYAFVVKGREYPIFGRNQIYQAMVALGHRDLEYIDDDQDSAYHVIFSDPKNYPRGEWRDGIPFRDGLIKRYRNNM